MKTTIIGTLLLLAGLRPAVPPARSAVLVELFTSEGCSSCPPADALLASLLQEQPIANAEIVAFELHVDYWDRLGWKDPFCSRAFTNRQESYARSFGGTEVYTPQMVVDGREHLVGSDRAEATKAIGAAAAREHLPLAVSTRVAGESLRMTIDLPAAPRGGEPVDVFAAVIERELTSVVARGENGGRTLKHAAVVRKIQTLGSLEPQPFVAEGQWKIERSWIPRNLHAVAWLQGRKTNQVYGAATGTPNRDSQ